VLPAGIPLSSTIEMTEPLAGINVIDGSLGV
jgi:hypothetical protein